MRFKTMAPGAREAPAGLGGTGLRILRFFSPDVTPRSAPTKAQEEAEIAQQEEQNGLIQAGSLFQHVL